jgi:Tuberculosis necrotizing toxin
MRCRSFTIGALTALTISLLLPVSAKAASCPPQVSPAVANADSTPYKVPDGYPAGVLGPETLPTGPVAKLLAGYNRLGTPPLSEKDFLTQFMRVNPDGSGDWIYPTNFGFDGPDEPWTLKPGDVVDRFGSIGGSFLANKRNTPFAARALPPTSLNTVQGNPQGNYHVYCFLQPLTIRRGKIAGAFGQPGGGVQYVLGNSRVTDLITSGTLVEVAPAI